MTQNENNFDSEMLPDMLPLYYKRLFPFDSYYKWLNYGDVDSRDFCNREFSFTLHEDIYIRYQSYNNRDEMEEAIKAKSPHKIDIGAVYSFPPSNQRRMGKMIPIAHELVFDIDLTDYDDIRNCCQGANVCAKCWKFMVLACKIIDVAIREDFGYHHLLWVFSGRRGIHCWICDPGARKLKVAERSAVAEYLQLVSGGANCAKKVKLPIGDKLHSHVRRSVDIIRSQFLDVCVVGQGLFQSSDSVKKLLSLISDEKLKIRVQNGLKVCSSDEEKWHVFERELKNANVSTVYLQCWSSLKSCTLDN